MKDTPEVLDKITDIVLAYRPKSKRKKPKKSVAPSPGEKLLAKVKRAGQNDQSIIFDWLKKRLK